MNRKKTIKRILYVGCCWQIISGSTHARQESPPAKQVAFQQQSERPSNDQLVESLEMLREQTRQLNDELKGEPGSSATWSGVESISPPTAGPQLFPQVDKVGEIQRNIQLLQELFAEKQRRQLEDQPKTKPNPQTVNEGSSAKAMVSDSGIDVAKAMEANEAMESKHTDETDQWPAGSLPVSSNRVVPKIVDAFELGNSLFMAGDLEQSLKSYQSVQRTSLSPFDRTRLEFMIASCHRGLGDYDQAAASYRLVEQDLNGVRFVQSAKEWHEFLKKRAQMNDAMTELTAKTDHMLKRAEALTNDPKK